MGTKERNLERRGRGGAWLTPAVDIYETKEGLTLIADLPGVERKRLRLDIEGGTLTVEGEGATAGYRRHFALPDGLDLERVGAVLKDGVLTMTLPKAAAARPRHIEVTVH